MTDYGFSQKVDVLLIGGELAIRNWLKHYITSIGMSVRLLSDGWGYQDQKTSTRPSAILIIAQSDRRTKDSITRISQNSFLRDIPTLIYVGPGKVIPADITKPGEKTARRPATNDHVCSRLQQLLQTAPAHCQPPRLDTLAPDDVDDSLMLGVNPNGRILWASDQVQRVLNACQTGPDGQEEVLSHAIGQLLVKMRRSHMADTASRTSTVINNFLYLNYVEHKSASEIILELSYDCNDMFPSSFLKEFALTSRECEVLTWLSTGKSNRAIALVLALRPRTVDKYLEQIYSKLGIRNRTAAAAIAIDARRNKM